jgi:hypothetical protein
MAMMWEWAFSGSSGGQSRRWIVMQVSCARRHDALEEGLDVLDQTPLVLIYSKRGGGVSGADRNKTLADA